MHLTVDYKLTFLENKFNYDL